MTTTETTTPAGTRPVGVAEGEARLAGAEGRVRAAQAQAAAADGLAGDLQGVFDGAEQDRSAAEADLARAELHLDRLAHDGVDGQVRAVAERRLADAQQRWAWCERRAEDAWALAEDADAARRAAEREWTRPRVTGGRPPTSCGPPPSRPVRPGRPSTTAPTSRPLPGWRCDRPKHPPPFGVGVCRVGPGADEAG